MGEEITGNQQDAGNQIDTPAPQSDVTVTPPEEGKQISNIPEVNEYLKSQEAGATVENPGTEQAPPPIEIDGKQYTREELANLIKGAEPPKEEETQPVIREIEQVEAELTQTQTKAESDYRSFFARFMARANAPVNPYTQQQDPALVQRTLGEAGQSGDFTEFMKLLSPVDQVEFLKEKTNLENTYAPKLEELAKEKDTVGVQKEYKENLSKWDAFIATNLKDDKAAQHFFNHGKSTAYFDEAHAKEIYQKFQEAVAVAVNSKELNSQTEAVKKAMAGINAAPSASVGKVFTRADIKNMSPADFNKNEAEIFRQLNVGLIK